MIAINPSTIDWSQVFDHGTLARGQTYAKQRKVLAYEVANHDDHLHIFAKVQGNSRPPYNIVFVAAQCAIIANISLRP